MSTKHIQFKTKAKLWIYPGESANWHFLTLPKKVADEIKGAVGKSRRGFGAVKVEVTIGKTEWLTSIFPDKHSGSYLLPIKAAVRKQEDLWDGEEISFAIKLI